MLKSVWDSHSVPSLGDFPCSSWLRVTLTQHSNPSVSFPRLYHYSPPSEPRGLPGSLRGAGVSRAQGSANSMSLLPLGLIRGALTPRGKHGQCSLLLSLPQSKREESGHASHHLHHHHPFSFPQFPGGSHFYFPSAGMSKPPSQGGSPPPPHLAIFAKLLLCNIQGIEIKILLVFLTFKTLLSHKHINDTEA